MALLLLLAVGGFRPPHALATPADPSFPPVASFLPVVRSEAAAVCAGWVELLSGRPGGWAGSSAPVIGDPATVSAGDTVLAWCFPVRPRGYVVVSASHALVPIIACSDETDLDPRDTGGMAALLRDALRARTARAAALGPAGFTEETRALWNAGPLLRQEAGPLLATAWHQGEPYNLACPPGDLGLRCVVGCSPLAVAQLMRFWSAPAQGTGSVAYWWNGDRSCGGSTPGDSLRADCSDPFDWGHMPDSCSGGCTPEEEQALAELCYEVGVAMSADFGACGTAVSLENGAQALETNFGYLPTAVTAYRGSYSASEWFGLIRDEIDRGRPMLYGLLSHSIVCDGYRDAGGLLQIHVNYGWGGPQTGWYTIDQIYGSDEPAYELVIRNLVPASAAVLTVYPDGSGPYPDIQSAVDAAEPLFTVELADGIFRGPGNRNIDCLGKRITVRGRSGDATRVTIDCGSTPTVPQRGFVFQNHETPETVVEDLAIVNGRSASWGGGAISATAASPVFRRVIFSANLGYPAVLLVGGAALFEECTFCENEGGALKVVGGSAGLRGCTVAGNGGSTALEAYYNSHLAIDHTIISGNAGSAVQVSVNSGAGLSCSDLFANSGGDWTGDIAGQADQNGNLCADPLLCTGMHDFRAFPLQEGSPCSAGECGQIGAWPVGCDGETSSAGETSDALWPVLRVVPNPCAGACRFLLDGERGDTRYAGRVIELFDVAGRFVKALPVGGDGALWNATDAAGRALPAGVYHARLRGEGKRNTVRILIAR